MFISNGSVTLGFFVMDVYPLKAGNIKGILHVARPDLKKQQHDSIAPNV